jgi:hypothetical protein
MNNVRTLIAKKYSSVKPTAIAISTAIIFASGLGRYRLTVVIFIYFATKAILKINKVSTVQIDRLYIPFLIIGVYYDFSYGQIYPVFTKSNPVLAFFLVIVTDALISNFIKKKIETLTDYQVFAVCPKCNFEMKDLVELCENCGYSTNNLYIKDSALSTAQNRTNNLSLLLELERDETFKLQIKLGGFTAKSVFKNDQRLLLSKMIITNKRLFLLDWKPLGRGLSYKVSINLSDIIDLNIVNKFHINKQMPIIKFITKDNSTYELYFVYLIGGYNKLKPIASCLLNNNISRYGGQQINLNLPDDEALLFGNMDKKTKQQATLLLISLLIVFAITLWRLLTYDFTSLIP